MQHKHQRMAEVVNRHLCSISSDREHEILDIGYAQLPNRLLVQDGRRVHGIDIVSAEAPGYQSTEIVDLNTQELPYGDGSIDVVAMGCTLAHLANPLKALADINRVLTPEGILIVSTPNPNYYWENILNVFYHHFKTRVSETKHYEHFFEFSRYNMRTSAERSGFVVEEEIGCTFKLVKLGWKFDPKTMPGLAYEIVYVLKKVGSPEAYATFEDTGGIHRVPTRFT